MKFMLLIYHEEQSWNELSDAEKQQIYGEYRELIGQLQSDRKYLAGEELQTTAIASTVRVRDGKAIVTDGPFAETREQVGGFFLIEAKDLDEANKIAARIPSAQTGAIEVRAVADAAAASTA
jgi:hypothetical protein